MVVDDHSDELQFNIGCKIARESNGVIKIVRNEGKGVQSVITTAFNLLDKSVKWIYFPQQDVYPKKSGFINKLDKKLRELDEVFDFENGIGALGFEIIDQDERHSKKSSLGYLFLSENDR